MNRPPVDKHELHAMNRCSDEAVLAARLVRAFERIDQEKHWVSGPTAEESYVNVPVAFWAAVEQAAKLTDGYDVGIEATAFCRAVDGVSERSKPGIATGRLVRIKIDVSTWADLLGHARRTADSAGVMNAIATEHYIEHGSFQGFTR